jgi:geranylgeranyl pyrophosphate synthase
MIEELCIGQLVETTELFDLDRSIDSQLESIKRKTGVLFGCACRLGAMCAFGDDRVIEGMARFGENFGIAFQLIDDVLDLVSDESRGKQANIDLASGVYTMPVLLALDTPRSHDLRRALEARDATTARALVLEARTIPEVIKRAHDYGKFATQALAVLHPLDTPLGGFPERYIDWALEYFPVDAALIA